MPTETWKTIQGFDYTINVPKKSDYLILIAHASSCFDCRSWLLGCEDETLCFKGRRILQAHALVLAKHAPVGLASEPESESELARRTR